MHLLSELTPMDKQILTKSWAIVSRDMETLAVSIFQMIFEQAPDAKLMFTFMMKDYREDEKKSSEFTFHALRFIQVIESVVTNIDSTEHLDPLFLNLGRIHARHQEQLGFSSHYWGVFKECVLFHFRKAMKGDRRTSKKDYMNTAEIDSAIILWREVLRLIIARMKVGFESNGLIRKANRQEVLSGKAEENGPVHSSHSADAKQGVTQALRRTELSVIVPEYFIRRKSEDVYSSNSNDNSSN